MVLAAEPNVAATTMPAASPHNDRNRLSALSLRIIAVKCQHL